ncbi:HisA/HisF-related TIM barrel protein [Sphingomonas sp. ASV193]|uniref:1-(5-phosphoribosyl)-5-[(5- phosphoribosylamino)methylideneamino]imidazole-4- carboxamide isomerase n=1 Tax=Sphingomonas sp. ASV193 TaxID=3144405 RepID=UPI0032E89768
MILYPAMDLIGGSAVRLRQGDFDAVTRYPTAPAEALDAFAEAGAAWAHLVDLDGAKAREPRQHALIAELARGSRLSLQVAGGFRETDQLARMFDAGVARVVIGSLAVERPELVNDWLDRFGAERITLSLDVRLVDGEPMVSTAGWTRDSGRSLWDVATAFPAARHLLVTDIGRDGMMAGPNFDLYRRIGERLPKVAVQASGGVSSLADLDRLDTAGAIVGKALWDGAFTLREALAHARA